MLLSYPNRSDPSVIRLINSASGAVLFESQKEEARLTSDQDHPDIVPPFNGYSATGDASGRLLYVNYATPEDFEFLLRENIEIEGAICIARYAKIARMSKVDQIPCINYYQL